MFYGKSLKNEMTAYKNDRKYLLTVYLMRDLYSRICSELSQLSNKKTLPIKKKKTVEDLNMYFPKRMYKWPIRTKRCSILLAICEMQITTTMRCYFIIAEVAVIKTQVKLQVLRMWRSWNPRILLVESKNISTTLENSFALPQKGKHMTQQVYF